MKKKHQYIALAIAGLVLLAIRSFGNYTIWEWIGSISMMLLIIQFCHDALELEKHQHTRNKLDYIIDALILIMLTASIFAIPNLVLTNSLLAFFYYFTSKKYHMSATQNKGLAKRYAVTKFNTKAPLVLLFAGFAIASIINPEIFGQIAQSILLAATVAITFIWPFLEARQKHHEI